MQIISVRDTTAPVITCPTDITIDCTDSTLPGNLGIASATDNCDLNPIVISSDSIIASLVCPQAYTIERTWTATDACGNSSTCLQLITVQDTTPPVISCPSDITIQCDDDTSPASTGVATATDNCDPSPEITFDDVTIDLACGYSLERTWTATDSCGNTSTCLQIISVQDTTAPVIICPTDVTVECASDAPPVLTGGVTTSDNCGFVTVTHGGDIVSDSTCLNRLTITRVYIATDECDNTATCAQVITVFDDTPPTLTCPAGLTISCASAVPPADTGITAATDNCGDTVTVTSADVITNMTCANRFTLTRTYTATDACGNTATCTQTILVNDITAPTITCPANVTVSCASQVPPANPGGVVASDNCGGLVTVTVAPDVITNMTCANRFTVTRTYTATDVCGNTATCNQTISVFDIIPPAITCPANVTVPCASLVPPANIACVVASDNCGGSTTVTSRRM